MERGKEMDESKREGKKKNNEAVPTKIQKGLCCSTFQKVNKEVLGYFKASFHYQSLNL